MLNTPSNILRIEYTPNNQGFSIYVFGNKVFDQPQLPPGSTQTVVEMAEQIAAGYYESTVKVKILDDLLDYYENVFYKGLYKDTINGNFWKASYFNIGSLRALLDIAVNTGKTSVIFYDYDDNPITFNLSDAQAILVELGTFIDNAYKDYKFTKKAIKDDTTGNAYTLFTDFITNHEAKMTPEDFNLNPYNNI